MRYALKIETPIETPVDQSPPEGTDGTQEGTTPQVITTFKVGFLWELFPDISPEELDVLNPPAEWVAQQGLLEIADDPAVPDYTTREFVDPYLGADGKIHLSTDVPYTLDQMKQTRAAELIQAAQNVLKVVTASYPELEVATWNQQYAEALAFTADNRATTPMLSTISSNSGFEVDDLAQSVIAKANAYSAVSGAVVGKRIRLTYMVEAATTVEQVKAIVWDEPAAPAQDPTDTSTETPTQPSAETPAGPSTEPTEPATNESSTEVPAEAPAEPVEG